METHQNVIAVEDNMLVSVIIPTFNSEKTLDAVLLSIKRQTYNKIEVIIVDNNSKDMTIEIAREYRSRIFQIDARRSKARNYGAEKAEGSFFLFLDSDIELAPKVVEQCVNKISEGFDAVVLPEIIVGEGFWAKCRALEAMCYLNDPGIVVCPRFFKKEVFEEVGGYDENIEAGEDWDIRERLKDKGFTFTQIDELTMHNEGRVSLLSRVKKKYQYGLVLENYTEKNKHRNIVKKQFPLFRAAYYKNWKLLIRQPIYAGGFLLMKLLETLAVAMAFAIAKLYWRKQKR